MKYILIGTIILLFSCTSQINLQKDKVVHLNFIPSDAQPPKIELLSVKKTTSGLLSVQLKIEDENWLSMVMVNSQPVPALMDSSKIKIIEKTINIEPGTIVRIVAVDIIGLSSEATFQVTSEKEHKKLSNIFEKRLALVIGNQDYQNITPLKGPKKETRAFAESLRKLNFEVLDYYDLDIEGFFDRINFFKEKMRGYDVLLVYFSGHAVEDNKENFLLPIDVGNTVNVETECIKLQDLSEIMKEENQRTNIVILDACRSISQEVTKEQRSLNSAGSVVLPEKAPPGSFFAFATNSGKEAGDGTYTPILIEKIQQPYISIEEVFKQVRFEVYKKTNGAQIPVESSQLMGHFIFNPGIIN
ncbi:MAG: caspase family protein [Flammeovirgaceae bacterium]|nr:caspase family protein [Flammeovirgaceae bacterium]